MRNNVYRFSLLMLMQLININPSQAEIYRGELPLYPNLNFPAYYELFNFQYAQFNVPDNISEFKKRTNPGPWLEVIKTPEALQALYKEAWTFFTIPLTSLPPLPSIDFEHYQLVMGGPGSSLCGIDGSIQIQDISYAYPRDHVTIRVYIPFDEKLQCKDILPPGNSPPAIAILMAKTDLPIVIQAFNATIDYNKPWTPPTPFVLP